MPKNHDLRMKEINNLPYYCCPTCSKNYPAVNEKKTMPNPAKQSNSNAPDIYAPLNPPDECERCGSPMDAARALAFGHALATKEHQPNLTKLGNAVRVKNGQEAIGAGA